MKKLEKLKKFDVNILEKKNLDVVKGGASDHGGGSSTSTSNATGVETDTCKGTTGCLAVGGCPDTSRDGDYYSTC